MEVRRRSFSSGYEFRERSGRKKKGALPLAMMLTFNDKDVHPDCPNVSNPYHKCGRHCLREIPHGKMFLDAIRSDEDRVCDNNKSEKKRVNPKCPHASNPDHKCTDYCLEKMSEKRQDAGNDQSGMNPNEEKKEIFTTERRVKPACLYASNPYHVCAEYCFQTAPEKDKPRQSIRLKGPTEREKVLSTKEKSGFHTQCKLASNPSHECTESCFQSVTDRNLAEGEKPKGVFNKTNKNSVHLNRSASSFNKINEHCFEYTPKKEHLKGGMRPKKENEIVTTQRGFTSECKNASNPYHVCVEYCFQSVPEREQHGQVVRLKSSKEGENVMSNVECTAAKPKEESEIIVTVDQRVNLEYKNLSNPSHVCPEYCSENIPERERHEEVIRLKSTKEGDKFMNNRQTTGFDPQCKQASKPHHECTELCFKNTPDRNLAEGENLEGMSMETDKYVHSSRKHASSPNDKVIEYYCEDTSEKEHPEGGTKPKEERIVVTEERRVNLVCKYASNPYHECSEYCCQNLLIKDQSGEAIKKFKEEEIVVLPSERRVSPDCKFSSNPYHVCTEYCLQNGIDREQHGQVMKLKSFKELKKLVSKKKITSVQPQCEFASNPYHKCAEYCFNKNIQVRKEPDGVVKTNERRKERSYAPRRDDNPKYKNALNSFGRCAEYSPEEISPKNEVVKGSTAAVKERKRNSFKENIRNHPIVEKISLNSNYMEASKPSHNYIDSSEGIILQNGAEKSSMDSKYVEEAFNPTNSSFNLNNGISMCMQDGTEDLQSAKVMDMKNPKEATDMAPLQIDVSDLFHEWSKYCSQTELAADEIVIKQEKKGMGELISRRNGKSDGVLNNYDSTNMEKVEATGGFSRSLPISLVLFLLGFLLALYHWAQVIYSLVMSSEKNEKPHERMKHEKHSDPECKMVYDPYHNCSEYCFSGVAEEMHLITYTSSYL